MLKNFCKSNPFPLITLVLVITSLALLLSSGAFKMQNSQPPRFKTNTLRINLGCEPPSLDWAKATDAASFDVVSNIMVGLTAYTKDLSCSAACAESWQILDHGKRYIFHLRPNIYWSDGKPLTAY